MIHNGRGIFNDGNLTVVNSTITGNTGGGGGGIYNPVGTVTLHNTIVAANFSGDIEGAVASSSSHNLIGKNTGLSGISNGSNGNQIGTAAMPINPMLGELHDNGGPTKTMALLLGSPALNAGDNSRIPAGVTTDQRGPGFARSDNGTVDIGAYENQSPVANADTDTTDEDTLVTVAVLSNDSDADPNDTLTVTSATITSGLSTVSTDGTTISYDPGTAYNYLPVGESAEVTIDYSISDGHGGAASSTLTVTVNGVNDTPSVVSIGSQHYSETEVLVQVEATDPDDGDTLTYGVNFVSKTGGGAVNAPTGFSIDANGLFHWTPGAGQLGAYTFEVEVSDGDAQATEVFTVTTLGVVDEVFIIVGTSGIDKIVVKPTDGDIDSLTVRIHERDLHFRLRPNQNPDNPYTGVERVLIHSLGGNDDADINNHLWGGDGNDFLIGGDGVDRIRGEKGHDILVSGDVSPALDWTALRAISAAWANSQMVTDSTVDEFLDETFGNDGDADTFTGGAGTDLFIINTGDTITDFKFGKPNANKDGDVVIRDGVIVV